MNTPTDTLDGYTTQTYAEATALETQAQAEGKKLAIEVSDGSGFGRNGKVYDTVAECQSAASDLFSRWMGAREWRVCLA